MSGQRDIHPALVRKKTTTISSRSISHHRPIER